MSPDVLAAALRYAKLGYAVFPCRPGTKKPYTANGFKDATLDVGLIEGWWMTWPQALVATPDTCTVDIETKPDGPNGWDTWARLTAEHCIPDAPTVRTGSYPAGRGAHLHFAYRADLKAGTFADGIELRAAGAYVLLPPSRHPTGVVYEGELPPIGDLPNLPEWIAEMRRNRKRQRNQKTERVAAGERHERWIEEAGRLRKQGVPVAEARRRLLELRAQEFENPDDKTDEELDAILDAYADDWDGAELHDDVIWLSAFDLKQVEWVEKPLLQIAFTLLAGRPGIGKGALVARLVARCTNGEMYGQPRPAILLSTEDDPEIDLGPRIEVAGGNRSLVAMPPTTFQMPRDIEWLRGYVEAINAQGRGNTGLIAIDPVANHTGDANTDRENEVRTALMPLAVLVNELKAADRRRPSPVHQGGEGRRARQGARLHRLDRRTPCRARRRRRLQRPGAPARPRHQGQPSTTRGGRAPLQARRANAPGIHRVGRLRGRGRRLRCRRRLGTRRQEERGRVGERVARELLVETLRQSGGRMESDELDAVVAAGAGLNARTVRNLRVELKDKGWLRSTPEKDESRAILRWWVSLTNAAPDHASRVNALGRDLDYSSQMSRDLDEPDHPRSRHHGYARESVSGASNGSTLTPEQAAAIDAYFAEHADEHGHV